MSARGTPCASTWSTSWRRLPEGLPADSPFQCAPLSGHAGTEHATTCDTNLHTHGFHVSPSDNSDNPFLRVAAGESFQYEFQLPADHPSGIYHYHPHLHGASHKQVFGGMVGAIIIEGDLDRLPGIDGVPERLLILQTTQLTPDGGSVIDQGAASRGTYLRLVNGQLNPTMTIQPGETQRWRVQNLTASTTFRLRLDGHQLHQIAKDGNTLNETWTRDDIVLFPGERVEVLVQGGPAGTYALRTLPFSTGFTTQVATTLATLVSAGAALTPQPLPTTLLPRGGPLDRGDRRAPPDHLPDEAADRSTDRSTGPCGPDRQSLLRRRPRRSGRSPQHDRGVGDPQRLHPVASVPHPHQRLSGRRGQWAAGAACATSEDTTPVPPFGEITIRTRFRDFPGRWVYHCHILLHEDHGMMGTVKALA